MTQNRTIAAIVSAILAAIGLAGGIMLAEPLGTIAAFVAGAAVVMCLVSVRSAAADSEPDDPAEPVDPIRPDARALLDAAEEPILLVRERHVLVANPAARALLGEHIEGDDVRLAIRHPAAAERLLDLSDDAATRTDLAGLGDPDQRWEMAITTMADQTRMVRLIDRSQAHIAEQTRADFVANASHELRTPLATLLGFLETLEDEEVAADPAPRRKFLTIMAEEAQRMRALVDDLMSLSRVEADRFSVPRDSVDLVGLVETVGVSLAHVMEQRGSSLILDKRSSQATVIGDQSQLAQLLTNLITNALRYGRPGTPVRVRVEDAGAEMIRLSVIDQGDGIAAEHLPRLTERFYRVDASRSRSVGGTGLGLAIVKHIALRHRGRLDIRSTLGEGTSVRVYLPRQQG